MSTYRLSMKITIIKTMKPTAVTMPATNPEKGSTSIYFDILKVFYFCMLVNSKYISAKCVLLKTVI